MMPVHELLHKLAQSNVKLWVEENRLRLSAPSGVLTSDLQEELRQQKHEVIQLLAHHNGNGQSQKIQPAERGARIPLSFAQQRLWFLAQLEGPSATYNLPAAFCLRGELRLDALQRALNNVVARHEILRTTFAVEESTPFQVIAAPQPVTITVSDLGVLPPTEQAAAVQALIDEDAQMHFDLVRGPLLFVQLVRLSAAEHVLSLNMHHIISDGWSATLFMQEFCTQYISEQKANRASPLAPLPLQYADYAVWQQQQDWTRQLDFWRNHLTGAAPLLELPLDHPRPAQQHFAGDQWSFALDGALSEKLEQFAREEGVTLHMVLLATFALLLSRYSGSEDLVIGTPVANRNRPEIEEIIGFFVNTLALRFNLQGNPTFRELLQRVRQVTLDGYAHQDAPFEQVVELLQPQRQLSHMPLFQVVFNLMTLPDLTFTLPGLMVSPLESASLRAKFDLALNVSLGENRIGATWEYNCELFEQSTIQQMAQHWQQLLVCVVAAPHSSIDSFSLFTTAELQQLLLASQGEVCPKDERLTIQTLFEQQVDKSPTVPAIRFEDRSLTYRQLNEQANQLARHMQIHGVQAGDLVGLCIDRSPEMVIGILAILKAGGAYLPLDPQLPGERLRFMVQDAGIRFALTSQRHAKLLETLQIPAFQLDTEWHRLTNLPTRNLQLIGDAAALIYLIYTSGSTGSPKGVRVLQRGVVNTITALIEESRITVGDRLLQFVPFTFDASALEFFTALCSGATLVLHPNPTRLSSLELLQLCQEKEISVVNFTVALWHQWVDDLTQNGLHFPPTLRLFLTGGEKPSPQRLQRWAQLGTHTMRFLCSYGPTEASITSTIYTISNRDVLTAPPSTIPLGRPLPNTAIYLLDVRQQPVPIGVIGEIYLGGKGLASGYHNQPTLTQERFVQLSWQHVQLEGERRFYRTGDLARRRIDGSLEFVGRSDLQVKVRGFRVELSEIESALCAHPEVTEAVVRAIDFSTGNSGSHDSGADELMTNDKRLVAYFTAETPPSISELKRFLHSCLPAHMLPSAFVAVESWPLTHSGKIDRNALPLPDLQQFADMQMEHYSAPQNELEIALATIWEALLGISKVSVEGNFFDMGGHSLLATQVISQIRQRLQMEVPLRLLFEKPTIRQLAAELTTQPSRAVRPPITAAERGDSLPLSFAQQRLWLLQQLNPESSFFNMPTALQLIGPLHEDAMHASFNEIVRRHEILRTSFPVVDGQPVQQIAQSLTVTIPVIDLQGVAQSHHQTLLRMMAEEEAATPFDLAVAPLLRIRVVRLAKDSHILLLTMHHIVGDDWSNVLLMQEFSTLYASFKARRASPLPELSIQYADFAQWQRDWLQGERLETQLVYWRNHLADAPPMLQLPFDHPRPAQQRFLGNTIQSSLSPSLSQRILELCRQQQITPHMILFAAFATLLSRYSGMDDIVIGIPVANRHHAQVEQLVGFFLNTLALRVKLHDQPTFLDLLHQVKTITTAGYEHQDIPFEQVSEALATAHQLSHTPLFQVMFNYLQDHSEQLQLSGLQVTPLAVDNHTAKFDLTLTVTRSKDEFVLGWEYNSELFEHTTIERMRRHFEQLLKSALADPSTPLFRLPMLDPDERHLLLQRWNRTDTDSSDNLLMHQLFERQAALTPDATAASDCDELITYRHLNERANRWARGLQERGVAADTVVAILAPRNLDFLTAILAIHKAGGAYLPIDPKAPAARIQAILRQSRASMLLIGETFLSLAQSALDALPDEQRPLLVQIGQIQQMKASSHNLLTQTTLDHLAYVIFTSGSTGVPKGAMVEQRGLVNHLLAMKRNMQLGSHDVIAQSATQSYVISVWQFLAALTIGCRVEIIPDEVVMDPAQLLRTIAERKVTVLQIVPSLLRAVMPEIERTPHLLTSLRWIIPTGEALPPALARQWFATCPQIPMLNAYGASECSDDVAHDVISQPPAPDVITMPAGRPIRNVQMYVLDQTLQPVPIGLEGDLYVGGACVGRGYLHDAERTAELFTSNPFSADLPGRLYKTGDRARWLTNGKVEYVGRKDFQVKIRGYRIELSEIEAVLCHCATVEQSVVVAREDGQGNKQLVAYVVAKTGVQTEPAELRAFVASYLPEYMVPATFILLEQMPLNANGKLDRLALPALDKSLQADAESYVPARNQVEAKLVAILADVLHVNAQVLGIRHSFFDLGGESLLAVQLLTQLRLQFGVELPLRSVFEHTTVEGLANVVIEAQLAEADEELLIAWLDEVEQLTAEEIESEVQIS